ncbi:hypothetical protein ACIQB5_51230, partial [Streptomyces sp. NPDC088560]|uniref:hypothetical protein n=1 Tax=Streptomyces sp. NPDC088560 TaxID=3365868 RepID=UPI0037F21425
TPAPEGLAPAVLDLLTAVVEALDLPLPSIDDRDERVHYRLLERRTTAVRIALASLLDSADHGILNDAAWIRAAVEETPVTYAVFEPAPDGGAR